MKTFLILAAVLCAVSASAAPLAVGAKVPNPTLTDIKGRSISLKVALAGNPTFVIFYPAACGTCDGLFNEIKRTVMKLASHGCMTVAISPDLPADLAKTSDKIAFSALLSDPKNEASRAFGVVPTAMAAFLIGRDGTVRSVYDLDKNPLKGAEMIAAARALPKP